MSDPVDEMARVIEQTLAANALRLTTVRGGYVGGSQPHATLGSDSGAVEAIARGLLARKVAEPSRVILPAAQAPSAEPGLRAAAQAVVDALGFWEDSDGRQRVQYPVDRDGDSEPGSDAPFVALRAALAAPAEGEAP